MQSDHYQEFIREFPGGPVVRIGHFHFPGPVCVQSLVGKLGSHKPFRATPHPAKFINSLIEISNKVNTVA